MTTLPNTMRHIEISQPGEPEVLKIVEAEIPQPKSNEILIQVKAAGSCIVITQDFHIILITCQSNISIQQVS